MNIDQKTIWQQGSGDTDRNYSGICLTWDVILNGPGDAGKWPECKETLKQEGWSAKKITDLKRFCEDMKPGDIVVLRLGTNNVYGVGEIVGEYQWNPQFSDVDGWDLQHIRRVRWLWKSEKSPKKFPVYSLKQGDTTQQMDPDSPVITWLKNLEFPEGQFHKEFMEIPEFKGTNISSHEDIAEYLFDKGISNNSIESLIKEFNELTRIAKWYVKFSSPSETETVAYLVVPLLRALGWTPQKMAIEWNKVDLALFDSLPRKNDHLSVVVEAKRKGNSCLSAKSQALSYAREKPHCKRLIVTEGIRYGVNTV